MNARMTIIGMIQELKYQDKNINDTWELEDIESYSKETLLATIVMKGATFEPLYTNPDYFYYMCGMFWEKWKRTIKKWFEAFELEYNPLENYDRNESWHEDIVDIGSSGTTGAKSDNNTVTNDVSAMDSSSYSPHDKSTVNGSESYESDTDNSNDRDLDHRGRIHGNIGVTTSQQMLESEIKVQAINVYDLASDLFLKELTLTVY